MLKDAVPEASVATGLVPLRVPGVPLSAALTDMPVVLTKLFCASATLTTTLNGAPLAAVPGGWLVISSFAAAPAVRLIEPETASVSPVDFNVSEYEPTVPLMPRFANVATPDAFVDADAVPRSVPPPPVISAVIVTPA